MARGGGRGAGRGGGLLFLAVLVFVAYLAVTALDGAPRLAVIAALGVAIVALAANVMRRR